MSKEAMQQALEALEAYRPVIVKRHGLTYSVGDSAITALREALAEQPAQQEPVDFASLLREAEELVREKPTWKRFIEGTPLSNDIAVWMTVFAQDVARRTSPPAQRTWVGLTDEDCVDAIDEDFDFGLDNGNVSNVSVIRYARAIEAKLKEKNT